MNAQRKTSPSESCTQCLTKRATFILDPQGRIASITANALEVGRSAAETLRLVQAFQAGGLTACEWRPGDRLLVVA